MKWILVVFLTFYCADFSFSQENSETMSAIKDQIEIIDSYMESDVFFLDQEEFLDEIADHGAELNGYYEHDRLKKIIRKIGMPNAMVITVFYFWNDQLIHVHYEQRQYMETKNSDGLVVMDYSNAFTKYESKYFFDKGKEIYKIISGKALQNIKPEDTFVSYAMRMKALLDDKFKNRNTYEALQGKWVNILFPDEYIIFEETIRFNFRDGKFLKRLKVKIKDGIMYCSSPKDQYVYKYEIELLDSMQLVVKDLQDTSSSLVSYKKAD